MVSRYYDLSPRIKLEMKLELHLREHRIDRIQTHNDRLHNIDTL